MPEEKTNLTKASVQGSDETASSRQQAGKPDLTDVDESGVPYKNRAEEYRKKYDAVAEKLEANEARLAELEDKLRLTQAEKAEKAKLEDKVDSLDAELHELETHAQYRAFRKKLEKTKSEAKSEAKEEAKKEFYADIVDDFLDDSAETLKMDKKDLKKELNKLLRVEHMEMNPLKRTKSVFKEFKAMREELAKREEERKAKEQEIEFSERDGRAAREVTLEEAKKKGDILSQIKHLGKY